jgi:hypothetical protein
MTYCNDFFHPLHTRRLNQPAFPKGPLLPTPIIGNRAEEALRQGEEKLKLPIKAVLAK